MSMFAKIKVKKKVLFASVAAAFASLVIFAGVLPNVFADTAYYLSNAAVELDGVNNGEVTISFNTPVEDSIFSVRGVFDTTAGGGHFTLTNLSPAGGITPNSNSVGDGTIYWFDSTWTAPLVLGERESMWSATYSVDKDTPADTYSICMSETEVASLSTDYDTTPATRVCAEVTVTRNDIVPSKLPQTIVLRDGEGHDITGTTIEKRYGDEPFEVTWERTVGNGAVSYHPDDDEFGEHVARTAGSNIEIDNVGTVDICAWAEETEEYAAAQSCITVHVSKRQLDIVGATIADKTYDGTTTAVVTDVDFSDRDLTNAEYEATATFDDENAGADKAVRVSVSLIGDAINHYVLNASNYNTTKTINRYLLTSMDMSISGGSTQTYVPGGVEPEVIVTANTHGGLSTLGSDDYDVEYVDNTSVGAATIRVTGKGNFTTGDGPVILDFNIAARGINNGNLNAPSSIVEHHILTADEISVTVDGVTLTRCANDGDSGCDYVLEISGDNDGVIGHTVNVAVNGRNNYAGAAVADVNVVAKLSQTVSFGDVTGTTVEREYRDANFTYTATTTGDGAITYTSSNPSIVAVNINTGEVEVKGVGTATITATAAETATYASSTAAYNVTVLRKLISVTSVTFRDKVYDGTPNAEIESLTLSDDSLVFGASSGDVYAQLISFNGVDTGRYDDVVAQLVLDDSLWDTYTFSREGMGRNLTVGGAASILPLTLTSDNAAVVLDQTEFTYSGDENKPTATVTVDLNGDGTKETTLVAGTDYEMGYTNNVNVGTSASAVVTGKSNYTGSLPAVTFTINPVAVTDVVVSADAQDYTGSALEPTLTVTGKVNGERKAFTTDDYTVAAHGNFVGAGYYTVTINSKDGSNYNIPTTSGTFTINKASSGEPAEMTAGLKIAAGDTLAQLGERSAGFTWTNPDTVVTAGTHTYEATYIRNNDSGNYLPATVSVPVYGLKRISILTSVNEGGTVTTPGALAVEEDELTWTIALDDGYELANFSVNSEDKTSEVSGGQFTMTAGTEDITAVVTFRRVYPFIKMEGQTHTRSVDGVALFEIDADYDLFEDGGEVYVDGVLLNEKNYRSWSASTMIELSVEFLDSLELGEHILAVVFNDGGVARATLNILQPAVDKPAIADTGVFTGVDGGAVTTAGIVVFGVAMLVSVFYVVVRRKGAES